MPGAICLSISEEPYALDEGIPPDLLPKGLQRLCEQGKVSLRYVPNTGPYRKLLPVLEQSQGQELLVATADDDTLYPEDWLEGLVRTYDAKLCVVAYRCRAMRVSNGRFAPYHQWDRLPAEGSAFGEVPQTHHGLFTLPTGVKGVLYNTRFFPDLALLRRLREIAPLQDDLVFRAATMCSGVAAIRVGDAGVFDASNRFRNPRTEGASLFHTNRKDNSKMWLEIMASLEGEGLLDLRALIAKKQQ